MTVLTGGQLQSKLGQVVAGLAWFRWIYGVRTDFEPMLAKLHATNEVLLLGTVDKPHCVHETRRGPVGYIVAQGRRATELRPAWPRSPTGTCSGALSRGGGQIYSIPRMDEPS